MDDGWREVVCAEGDEGVRLWRSRESIGKGVARGTGSSREN